MEAFLMKFFLGTVTGVTFGMVVFLVGSGLTLIFGVAKILNFAHGSLYMLGAYFAYFLMIHLEVFGFTLILAPIGVGLTGALLEKFLIKKVYQAPHVFQILLTYSFILIFDDLVKIFAGVEVKDIPLPAIFRRPPISLLGVPLPAYYVFVLIVTLVIILALLFFLYKTRFGKTVRAGACDAEMLGVVGINVQLVFTMVFALGSFLAGFGGALAGPLRSINVGMGDAILLDSFIIVIVGGLGSIKGAFVAAILLGLVRSWGMMMFPLLEASLPFILMAVILLSRPQGLFGKQIREF